jgi:hypothetical protein
MITFNTMSGIKTLNVNFHLNHQDRNAMERFNKRKRITISLCVISFSFLIMILPSTIFWAFFVNKNSNNLAFDIRELLDFISFLNHASIFYTSYLTNATFKKNVNHFVIHRSFCKKKIQSNNQNRSTRRTNNLTNHFYKSS